VTVYPRLCDCASCERSFIFAASNDRLGVFGSSFSSSGFSLAFMGADATKVLYVPLMTMPDVTIVMDVSCTGPAWGRA
jgi:hypothetical protein